MSEDPFPGRRKQLVEGELRVAGICDERVLSAISTIPREVFCEDSEREYAYENRPLPIPCGQTISQPYIVALMTEALECHPDDRVLEIGTGSGYAAAVLAQLVDRVYTIERHSALAENASTRFQSLGYDNIHVRVGDGTRGWPEHAPFDGIVITAAGPKIPPSLKQQLKTGGRLVMPLEEAPGTQQLIKITRTSHETFRREELGPVRFVPLIGEEAF